MFPAMMILTNLAGRLWKRPAEDAAPPPRFDFSDAREAYEHHTTVSKDMRKSKPVFRHRR